MKFQRGGFLMGLIVGLLVGLGIALSVALYVTKVPVPFVNKVPQRTPEQDAAEIERNKNWDPNGPLHGKSPARAAASAAAASGMVTAAPPQVPPPQVPPVLPPPERQPPAAAAPARDPAAILADRPATPAHATAARPGADPFVYFVQAGAYSRTEEAEQQRARLAMLGLSGKVTEREQAGRTVYRVRVGPFDKKEEADAAKEKLDGSGVEAALVRVQR